MEDYLKVIYMLEESGERVTTQAIAERMSVAAPSATGMIKRLADINLIDYERYRSIELTPAGRKIALEVVRHHRLLELYLAEALGYGWDEVHDEADRLEHTISEEFEARIDRALGFPTADPHGDPIPTMSGEVPSTSVSRLSTIETGGRAVVIRVAGGDGAKLRYFSEIGLIPRADVTVVERMPFNGPLRIRIDGQEHVIGFDLATEIFVSAAA